MTRKTCFFTGHRKLSDKKTPKIITNLNKEIDYLIQKGVTTFMSGGVLGFDQLAAWLIVSKKQAGANIRLVFALPCRNQEEKWTFSQRQRYNLLLLEADEVHCISERYSPGCMKRRNRYMVENSQYCIVLTNRITGLGETVRYANEKGLSVINVAQ